MADPQRSLEVLELVKVFGGSIITALIAVAGYIKAVRKSIDESIASVKKETMDAINQVKECQGEHETKIAVLETQQVNNVEHLELIRATTSDTNRKMDALGADLRQVLIAVNSHKP